MYENAKVTEAKYFYSQMSSNFEDRDKFAYNLSAFLSSARSVPQYALEEAKIKTGGQAWYDSQIAASSILPFFKDKRDVNIHAEPVKPIKQVTATTTAKAAIRVSASVIVKDANGNIKYQSSSEPSEPKPQSPSLSSQGAGSLTIRWKFSDWSGTEDIMTLCRMYIAELERFVKDGIASGFITG